jgi:arylsulfatase A-like enzyme
MVTAVSSATAWVAGCCQRYRAVLARPFTWLLGQLVTFFLVSLYVKFSEMRLTAEYASGWFAGGRLLANCLHLLLFCGQEISVFAALVIMVLLWRRTVPRPGVASRAVAWTLGLIILPGLSIVEIFGLAHFALFMTPLGPDEVRMIGWTRHVVTAANVLEVPEVTTGLQLAALGYCLGPFVWRFDWSWARPIGLATLAGLLVTASFAIAAPKPIVTDAMLTPHPLLWLVAGNHQEHVWQASNLGSDLAVAPEVSAAHQRYYATERPTNVLIFLLESTRAPSVALYNLAAPAGRGLLRFRDETVVFDNVYAPVPTSAHAMFSILYGVYPYIGAFWTSAGKAVVADSMAQLFGRAGYATHLFVTADLNYDDVRSFAARGFDEVLDSNDWPGKEHYALLPWGYDDRLLLDQLKRTLSARDQRPFFIIAATSNPHHPYSIDMIPGESAEPDAHKAYDRLVDYNLRLLAELYEWMKETGVAENTLLLVLGDHGEAFGEHPNTFGHAGAIYEENVHIPCFILHPRRLGLPPRIAQLGSQVDLRPTILDILGMTDAEPGDGMSLLREDPNRTVMNFTENGVARFGLRDAHYSYVYTPHVDAEQLFDRHGDPSEQNDIAAGAPALRARYRARLQRWEGQHQMALARVLQ